MAARKHDFTATEIKAGALVLASIAVFAAFAAAINEYRPRAEVKVFYARFADTLGLNKGADVRFGGAKVGRVAEIALDPDNQSLVRVKAEVRPGTPVNVDSVAFVGQTTLTAEKHLEITTGTEAAALLDDGAALAVRAGGLLDQAGDIASTVRDAIKDVIDLLGVQGAKAKGAEGEEAPGAPLVTLADIFGGLDAALDESTGLVEDARDAFADNRDAITEILDKVKEIEDNAKDLVAELTQTIEESRGDIEGSLEHVRGILEKVSGVAGDLEGMADSIDAVLANAESLSGTASAMLEDNRPAIEDVVLDLRETIRHLKAFARTVAEEPEAVIRGSQEKGRKAE
ncbi:MAG: MCE family protein [Candidatus Hydrogenedentes bacterium]|nr:MCE family protein [Candidatus Hydrogenedentota bacterium]